MTDDFIDVVVVHVTPLADLREHALSRACWCGPDCEWVDERHIVAVHHSMDGRELIERHGLQ